jgi:VanZ family protein
VSPKVRVRVRRVPVRSRWRTVLPFVAFAVVLAVWTWELLAENPVPPEVSALIPDGWKFWLAKGLHVVGYAFLTVLAAVLPVPRLYFWLAVALLGLHGIATEIGQTFVNGRHGSVRDVLLDWAGVGLGLAANWLVRWWRHDPYAWD